ncbi:MAG TPA: hypothetical protein VL171_10480 [Verrucomicrobiae bacterium]|nr:hypothetical protein [Verrucomicrobiae bacterium]
MDRLKSQISPAGEPPSEKDADKLESLTQKSANGKESMVRSGKDDDW